MPNSPPKRRRWFQFSLRACALTLIAIMIWHGHWLFLALGANWGTALGLAMSEGMRRATPDAWARHPNAAMKALVVVMLGLLIFWPVAVAMLFGGIALGIAEFLVISLSVDVVFRKRRGELSPIPLPPAPQP